MWLAREIRATRRRRAISADPERGTVPSTTTEIATGVSCCDMLLLCHAATRPARPGAAVWTIGEPPIVSAHSPYSQPLPLRWASMTDNSTNKGGTDAKSGCGLVALGSPDEEAALPEELIEIDDDDSDDDDSSDELIEIDEDDVPG